MELKQLISSVITEKPPSRSINEFVFLCRKIALVQLKRKLSSGRLHSEFFKSSPDDLAIDCIADLFQQDDSGTFVQIKTYFESLSLDNISKKDLLTHLRRFVFALSIYNTLGQRVALLLDEKQEAGYHEVTLDGAMLTSGVYFYRLHAGNFTSVQKMLLVK